MLVYILILGNFIVTLLALIFAFRLSVVYRTFNENVKAWASELDRSTNAAINRQSMLILQEIDERLTKKNQQNESQETL